MRRLVLAALAACGMSPAGAAEAAGPGSGTINFDFTGCSGPFGLATTDTLGDQSQWPLLGLVNGQIPTTNGARSSAGGNFV
jgi:hypothetical protein